MKLLKNTILFILLTLAFISCSSKTPYTNRSQMIFVSQAEELSLGEKLYKNTLANSIVIRNTKESKRVKAIGKKLALVSNRPDFKWQFNLIENKAMNAFCLPGGKVVVYTGLLNAVKNDSQLATVMSHEIAHALARHGAERMSSSMIKKGISKLANVLIMSTNPEYVNVFNNVYGITSELAVMLPYSRLQENEADEIGIYLMKKANYDLSEAIAFWKNMSDGKKQTNELFSTHPSSNTRIDNIQKIINKLKTID